MTSINELMPSRFLKKEDVIPDVLVTVGYVKQENIANNNEPPELKAVVYFHEFTQGLLLNQVNKETLTLVLGTDQIEHWVGKQVTLWNDRSVSMHGKLTGGVRIRIPQFENVPTPNNPPQNNQPTNNQGDHPVNPSTAQAYDANGNPIY